jgi:hypothetical protein
MTLIYHALDGTILFTVEGDTPPPNLEAGDFVVTSVAEAPGNIGDYAIVEGNLALISMSSSRESAMIELNSWIAAARSLLVTSLPGQDMIYLAKEAEARAWVAAVDPQLEDYPLLEAEAGITAPDADQLAQLWLNMGALWRGTAAQLERLRMTAIGGITAAATPAALDAVMAQIAGELQALQ